MKQAAAPPDTTSLDLTARVLTRVAGHGIARSTVEETVSRVLRTLADGTAAAGVAEPSFVVAVTARSLPDLASRLRRDLEREGVVIEDIGIGTAGQHTVVTLRLPAAARAALERVRERSRYSMSYLNDSF